MRLFQNTDRKNYLKLGLAAACCLAVGLLYVAKPLSAPQVDQFIQTSGYYFCALLAFCLVFFLFRAFFQRPDWRPALKRAIIVFLGILPIGVFVHLHEPHRFKVLNDEYAISSLAQQMHLERKAAVPGQSHQIGHNLYFMSHYADKRSQFFPFLVSLAHDLTGYRPNNVFWVNGLLTMGLLCLIYASVRKVTKSMILGYWACLFVASIPLLPQVATSAGYDLANVFFIWLLIYASLNFLDNPGKASMNALVACGLALAYVRYESILYLLPVVFLIAQWWWRERKICLSLFVSVAPLLLALPILLNLHMLGNTVFQDAGLREDGVNFFGLEHILPNLKIALGYFFTPTDHTTASVLCSALGLLGVIFMGVTCTTRGFKKEFRYFLVGGSIYAILVVCFIIVLSNFWGQLDDYQAVRFALPLYVGSALGASVFLKETLRDRLGPWILGLQTAYLIIFSIPTSAKHFTTKEMVGSYFQEWVIEKTLEEDEFKILLLIKSNLGAGLYGIPSIPLKVANSDPRIPYYFARDYDYEEVWVAEVMDFNANENAWQNAESFGSPASWMPLETLYEKNLYHPIKARISRLDLEGIRPENENGMSSLPKKIRKHPSTLDD